MAGQKKKRKKTGEIKTHSILYNSLPVIEQMNSKPWCRQKQSVSTGSNFVFFTSVAIQTLISDTTFTDE
jgi:hypothetical protein